MAKKKRRKKPKGRSKGKGRPRKPKKRGRPFSRVGATQQGSSGAWTKWGRQRAASDPTASRRRQVQQILESKGVYPDVARKIAYEMDPGRFYILRIYGFAGSDPNDSGSPGDLPILQATYVGSGARLWSRCIGYASVAPIEHVEIEELDGAVIDRPFWFNPKHSVKTVSGERVYGSGSFDEYRDALKKGAPKKSGGGMTADERRKNRKSKNDALKRRTATRKRIEALKAQGRHLEADRLLERSKRSRKVDL